MIIPSRPFSSIDELHAHELVCLERMAETGVNAAVPGALRYCEKHERTIPAWLLKASIDLLCRELKPAKTKSRGRASGPLARSRQDMIDYARWDEVTTVREKQRELLEETRQLRALKDPPKDLLKDYEKMLAWVGRSLSRAYECASLMLQNTAAFGGPEAMKRSYFKVRGSQKDPAQAFRHHLLDPVFGQGLGLRVHLPQRERNQAIYDLELED